MPTPEVLEQLKQSAALAAAGRVESGMIIGLGSGTTATLVVRAIAERVQSGLEITGIPTSNEIAELAIDLGITVSSLAEHETIDLTIDGADEVEVGTLNLIKGRGGALLREKIVAAASKRLLIVVDHTKLVSRLGIRDPLPVEVIPFGWQVVARQLRQLGADPSLRLDAGQEPYTTDSGHFILDCLFPGIAAPSDLARELNQIVGLVEHGLFLGMASEVIVGDTAGITQLERTDGQTGPQWKE